MLLPFTLGYYLLLATTGYALLCLCAGGSRRTAAEIAAVSGLLGAATVPMLLFWLSLDDVKPSRSVFTVLFCLSLAVIFLSRRMGRLVLPHTPNVQWGWMDWLMVPFVLLIGWSVRAVFQQTFAEPLFDLDAYGVWGLKAKVVYFNSLANSGNYFHDLSQSFSHLDYPLLLPFLTASGYTAIGTASDMAGKVSLLFLFCCYAVLLYAACRSLLPRVLALALAALGVSAPMFLRWSAQGTADVPLAIFYAGSIWYVVRWIHRGGAGDAWLAGILTMACAFTKNEGFALAIMNFFTMALFGWNRHLHSGRILATVATGCGMVLLPWLIFRHSLPHSDENYLGRLNLLIASSNLARLPEIVRQLMQKMFLDPDWCYLWWLIAAAGIASGVRRAPREFWALLFLMLAQLAVYVLIYIVTPYPFELLIKETSDRLLLQVFPTGILLMTYSVKNYFPSDLFPKIFPEPALAPGGETCKGIDATPVA